MTTLFGVNISKIVSDNIGPGVLPATLIVVTRATRTGTSTQGIKPTEVSVSGKGFTDSFSAGQVDGTIVKRDDVKVVLIADSFASTINPKAGDKITVEGNTYRIISVERDPASATYTCHSRK